MNHNETESSKDGGTLYLGEPRGSPEYQKNSRFFADHGSKSPASPTRLSDGSSGSLGTSPVISNPAKGNVEHRLVSKEAILDPDSGYVRKIIPVEADAVGYGFVLRGANPCYIQTVDPDGPASASGVKVGMYLFSVNDVPCIDKSHKDVANIIVESRGKIRLVVFHKEPSIPVDSTPSKR